ncbi:glutathione S-transferase family protein [Alteromonas sp. ASW11-130]|uniref:glutathione S-transferase family protein n=1 Tax=Alteromonas sp. ASW11-130 TaxID=3015775 RepID=UPI002242BF20|nr:glutathione S-transferase family protein [Alteromonas sp. ASW11-130]MCW8092932.1 glutathione S-transferase family protein [Alteromonas sp. ASW11-130]
MKLHNGLSPNGLRVSMFLYEKGISLPVDEVSIIQGDTRRAEFLAKNSIGQVPVLELENSRFLTESVAICRYLEAKYPSPPLFGDTAEQQAFIEMWNRRMELWIMSIFASIGEHEIPFFQYRVEQNSTYAASQRRLVIKRLEWLNDELADGRDYIVDSEFSIADITGAACLMLAQFIKLSIPKDLTHVRRWAANIMNRKSFQAC